MRVISGIYKRRRFDIPKSFKARPTTDFAKENLFNVLMKYIDFEDEITAADLFAGTGSISIELVSRGCTRVVAVEADRAHHAFICKIMKEVGTDRCYPIRRDVFRYIQQCAESFNLVFADPPYQLDRLARLPDLILGKGMVKPGGLLVLEHGKDHGFDTHPAFVEKRAYGSVHFSFFQLPEK